MEIESQARQRVDNLMSELDTCWCDVATGEATEFVKKYTDRIPVVHLKDYIKKGEVKNMYKLIGIDKQWTNNYEEKQVSHIEIPVVI